MSRRLALTSAALAAGVLAFVGAIVANAWPHAAAEIFRERSPVAWLSGTLLASCAAVALAIGLRERERPAFWALAAGLFALALDERFMLHERLKALILRALFDYDRAAMGVWGNAPMLLVPLAGAAVLWSLRAELWRRACRPWILAAFALGAVAIALDIVTDARPVQVAEELLEVASETAMLIALLAVAEAKLRG